MLCFHGTTKKGLNAILNNGNKPTNPWNCSDNDGCMYFWPFDKLDEQENERGIYQAFESAQVQAVLSGENELFCIICEIPDELLNDDYSCENMYTMASYIYCSEFNPDYITQVLKCNFNIWFSPFIAKSLIDNPNFNKYSLDENLLTIAENLPDNIYLDEICEFDYFEIDLKNNSI